jgi:hypothetical protein
MTYETQIRLERKFAQQIKAILGMTFIGQDAIADKQQATDFLVMTLYPIKVACRLRTYDYYNNPDHPEYKDEFTIRCNSAWGLKTEIDKIREGFCEYMFYGFVDQEEKNIIKYTIIDLNIFRDQEGGMIVKKFTNKDKNPTRFLVYNYYQQN